MHFVNRGKQSCCQAFGFPMNPLAGGCRDPWPVAVALVISGTQGHMENLLHNHRPELDSWPLETSRLPEGLWMTAGGGVRVKLSKLLIGSYWQNRDGPEGSNTVFFLKDEWTPLALCTRLVEYSRTGSGCCVFVSRAEETTLLVQLSFRRDI